MKYIILKNDYPSSLQEEVDEKMSNGYVPSGSLVVVLSGAKKTFYQPMVLLDSGSDPWHGVNHR